MSRGGQERVAIQRELRASLEDRRGSKLLGYLGLGKHHAAVHLHFVRKVEVPKGVCLEARLWQLDVVHRRVVVEIVVITGGLERASSAVLIEDDTEGIGGDGTRAATETASENGRARNARGTAVDEDRVAVGIRVIKLGEVGEAAVTLEEV